MKVTPNMKVIILLCLTVACTSGLPSQWTNTIEGRGLKTPLPWNVPKPTPDGTTTEPPMEGFSSGELVELADRIVGGQEAGRHSHPWIVSLRARRIGEPDITPGTTVPTSSPTFPGGSTGTTGSTSMTTTTPPTTTSTRGTLPTTPKPYETCKFYGDYCLGYGLKRRSHDSCFSICMSGICNEGGRKRRNHYWGQFGNNHGQGYWNPGWYPNNDFGMGSFWKCFEFLRSRQGHGPHFCGGSLISNKVVLTAAHCVSDETTTSFAVHVGEHSQSQNDMSEQVVAVSKIIVHPQYNRYTLRNDIAIVKLAWEVNTNRKEAEAIPFAQDLSPFIGQDCTVAGWGTLQQGGPEPDELQEVKIKMLTREACTSIYTTELSNGMFCAGILEGGKDSCHGDSGGPLTCKQGNNNVLVGLVSWGYGCAQPDAPGVYTDVAYFKNWITQNMQW